MTKTPWGANDGRGSFRRLLGFLGPYRWVFVGSVALGVVAAFFEAFSLLLLIPFLRSLFGMGALLPEGGRNAAERFIDDVAGRWLVGVEGLEGLRVVCLLVIIAILLKNVCLYAAGVLAVHVRESFARDLRNAVQARVQRLPMAYLERQKVGQLLARVMTDTKEAKSTVTDGLASAVRQIATVLAYGVALFALSWSLALMALVLVPIVLAALGPLLSRLRRGFRGVFFEQGELMSSLQENLSGVRLVKAWGAEAFEEGRFQAKSDRLARRFVRTAAAQQLASPLSEVLASGVAMGLVWLGAVFVIDSGSLGPEQFLAFVTIALRAISPVKALTQYPATLQQGLAAGDRFLEILDEPTEPSGGTKVMTPLEHGIRFEDVTFGYGDEPPVLEGLDLWIERGQVVALVGPSGGGKTTLVDLLPRFGDPQGGRITIDGTDIRELTRASLRASIGLVSQDTTLLHDTVSANIAYGEPDRATADIVAAARAAHAHEFIEDLPEGYDTLLGDRGVRLSGGQRQRIGIARAVLRDPPILILDEATSALDAESEAAVQDALEHLFRKRTVIVIAHRLSTVREADRIFVLEAGRIVDSGAHRVLIERDGPYRRLFGQQIEPSVPVG